MQYLAVLSQVVLDRTETETDTSLYTGTSLKLPALLGKISQ